MNINSTSSLGSNSYLASLKASPKPPAPTPLPAAELEPAKTQPEEPDQVQLQTPKAAGQPAHATSTASDNQHTAPIQDSQDLAALRTQQYRTAQDAVAAYALQVATNPATSPQTGTVNLVS
jgi:hypothetical protein